MKTKEEIFNIFKNYNRNVIDSIYNIWIDGYQHGMVKNEQEGYDRGFDAGYKACLKENEFVDSCAYCDYKENGQRYYINKVNKLIESGFAPCTFCEYESRNTDEYPCSQCTNNHVDHFEMDMNLDLSEYDDGEDNGKE